MASNLVFDKRCRIALHRGCNYATVRNFRTVDRKNRTTKGINKMSEKLVPYLDFKKKNANTLLGGIVDNLVLLKARMLEIKMNEYFLDLIKQKDDEFFVDISQIDKIPKDFFMDDEKKYNELVKECRDLETQYNSLG